MKQKLLSLTLACVLSLSMTVPAFAVEQPLEIEAAGAYLRERGVYQGDDSGDLMLDKGLTRAEMAAVLTRLHGEGEVNPNHYTWACYFTDVPDWAKPYVGYCTANLLVAGYDTSCFGPNDMVTPAMACTVVFRCCGYEDGEGSVWTYGSACDYAVSLGLLSQSTAQASIITRGEMAVLICRVWKQREQEEIPQVEPKPVSPPEEGVTPQSYTISTDHWSREDFSQQANPAGFTGVYNRALYNAIRQTIVDGTSTTAPAYTMVNQADYSAVKNVLGRMEGMLQYEHYVPQNFTNYWQYLNYFALSAEMPENYQAPLDFTQPAIQATAEMTDRETVEYFNDYIRTLLAYEKGKTAGITQTFAPHTGELKAACGSYARAMKFLCAAADIPCFTISSKTHTWNLVYVDGQWLHVDVSANDLSGINGNGEGYFADNVFHLTDDQKSLANNYASNLSMFLGDGLLQYTEYDGTMITALGDVRFTDGITEVVYFNQRDERYADKPYGTDNIGGYGCGPTAMSIVVSSLTDDIVDPIEMAQWSYENGGWCSKSGSYHSLIPSAAKAWGLAVEGCTASEPQRIVDALAEGKLVVAIMTKGHFTSGGHFIVLRGVKDGQIMVADPASYKRSEKLWDLSIILNEASKRAGAGGPFWIIG